MKRFIKVKSKWYDTLQSLKEGICFHNIDGVIYDLYTNTKLGELEEERDRLEEFEDEI